MSESEICNPSSHYTTFSQKMIRCGKRLTPMERVVLFCIWSYRVGKSGSPWVWNCELAKAVGTDTRHIQRLTRSISKKGALTKRNTNCGRANEYTINAEFFETITPEIMVEATTSPRYELPPPHGSGDHTPTVGTTTQERNLRSKPEETHLQKETFPQPAAAETGDQGRPSSSITHLITLWNQKFPPANLTSAKLAQLDLAFQKEIHASGVIPRPELIISAITDRPSRKALTFRELFLRDGQTFRWVALQLLASQAPQANVHAAVTKKTKKEKSFPDDQIDAIYQAYPRKVAWPKAKEAIQKALTLIRDEGKQSDPVAFLLAQTKAYGASRAGEDPKYTPYPATWFNQLRFADVIPTSYSRTGNVERVELPVVDAGPSQTEAELLAIYMAEIAAKEGA